MSLTPTTLTEPWNLLRRGRPPSTYYNWGMSVPFMAKKGINFTQIFEYCRNDQQKELSKKAPVHEVLLDMAVDKLPSPIEAQVYRIPNIWQGDLESVQGKSMIECDENGPLSLMITKIWMDPHAGGSAARADVPSP